MKQPTRHAGLVILLAVSWIMAGIRAGGACYFHHLDDEFTTVLDGDVPRNISRFMGFDALYDDGYDGSNVSIAVMDTGINGNHPDLQSGINTTGSLIVINESFVPLESSMDLDGHGTFIAGMLVGNGNASSGAIIGMAPAAEIWNLKVLDQNGEGEESWFVNGLDWILSRETKPDIVSLSLGSSSPLPDVETRLKQLWDAGVIVVVSSGNDGPDYYTINSPGNVLECMTVGASSTDEYLMAFSSEGPAVPGYLYKPDVVAFGLDLISTHVSGGYAQGSGTSFSVPFIDAGIALLHEATGKVHCPDEIKAAIIESARPLGYTYFMDGAGLPNLTAALSLLQDPGWNGWSILPGNVVFPVQDKDDTPAGNELERYLMKVTVINSRHEGNITLSMTGNIMDFMIVSLEEYDGGTDQFVVSIRAMETSSSFGSGTGSIEIKGESGEVLATIKVMVNAPQSSWVQYIVIGLIVAFLVGIVVTFAIAYNRGSRSIPHARCEIEGICRV